MKHSEQRKPIFPQTGRSPTAARSDSGDWRIMMLMVLKDRRTGHGGTAMCRSFGQESDLPSSWWGDVTLSESDRAEACMADVSCPR